MGAHIEEAAVVEGAGINPCGHGLGIIPAETEFGGCLGVHQNHKITIPVQTQHTAPESIDHEFRITGRRIEQFAVMTDMGKRGAVIRMYDILKKIGAHRELLRAGAKEDDKILIGERVFEFVG